MKQLLVVKPGTVTDEDKAKLDKINIVVIEHEKPNEVRVFTVLDGIDGDDILAAAFEAMDNILTNKDTKVAFTEAITRKVKARLNKKKEG